MNAAEGYVPSPAIATAGLVKAAAPVQVPLPGPYARKTIAPPGLKPPEIVALSEIAPGTGTEADAVVTMVGVAGLTVEISCAGAE